MLLRTPNPITPGKGVIYWNLLWDFPQGLASYFIPPGEGEVLSLHWDPFVLLQAGPTETHCTWNRTCTIERKEKVGVRVWYIPPQSISSGLTELPLWPMCMYVQPGQIPKAAKFPLFKVRQHVLFSTGTIICLPSLSPPLAWRML